MSQIGKYARPSYALLVDKYTTLLCRVAITPDIRTFYWYFGLHHTQTHCVWVSSVKRWFITFLPYTRISTLRMRVWMRMWIASFRAATSTFLSIIGHCRILLIATTPRVLSLRRNVCVPCHTFRNFSFATKTLKSGAQTGTKRHRKIHSEFSTRDIIRSITVQRSINYHRLSLVLLLFVKYAAIYLYINDVYVVRPKLS